MAATPVFAMKNGFTQRNEGGICTCALLRWARICLEKGRGINSYSELGLDDHTMNAQMVVLRHLARATTNHASSEATGVRQTAVHRIALARKTGLGHSGEVVQPLENRHVTDVPVCPVYIVFASGISFPIRSDANFPSPPHSCAGRNDRGGGLLRKHAIEQGIPTA